MAAVPKKVLPERQLFLPEDSVRQSDESPSACAGIKKERFLLFQDLFFSRSFQIAIPILRLHGMVNPMSIRLHLKGG